MNMDYYDMKLKANIPSYKLCLWCVVGIIFLLLILSLTGCRTEYVPVTNTHELHHYHNDTIKQTDTVQNERTTIIRELDSAAMAQYGIELRNAERAWLVLQKDMERRISELMSASKDTIIHRDTIRVPYPVERQLSKWERILRGGNVFLISLVIILFIVMFLAILRRRS